MRMRAKQKVNEHLKIKYFYTYFYTYKIKN